jgi:hypothetical protein
MGNLQLTRIRGDRLRGAAPGLLLAALGAAALLVALGQPFRLPSGRPGAGFVPVLLAAALIGLGLLHAAASAARVPAASGARAGLALCGAVAAFALLLPVAGFLAASWAAGSLALVAAPLRPVAALAGGGALAAISAALFLGALGLPTPLIGAR